jgi:DNA-binding transcriptional LysR family regulator
MGAAARELSLTKGAVSHQIKQLEFGLKFHVFSRVKRELSITEEGLQLQRVAGHSLGAIEDKVQRLRSWQGAHITIGMATYFASR